MTRLTKEEIDFIREVATACPSAVKSAPIILRALDELEERRAREGQRDGVTLSEEAIEKIREALERGRCALDADRISNTGYQFADALALLPPKRLPTLLEAAKAALTVLHGHSDTARTLRSAIEREEKKQ